MAVNDHAPLAPSSAHIWAAPDGCRASVAVQAAFPDPEDSPEAREGIAAHWFVAELLRGRDVEPGAVAPNGHPVDAEMVDGAQALLIDIRDTLKAAQHRGLRVEEKVYATTVHENACFGTPDAYLVDHPVKSLHVWDYKYGHRFVDAAENWQLLIYAIGILDSEGIPHADWLNWRVSFTIAQPRNYHPVGPLREWYIGAGRLLQDYVPQARQAAYQAMAPGAEYRTGLHCRDCSGRFACPALQRAGALSIDVSMQAQPVVLPPHAVGLELRQIDDAIKRLEARKTGLEEQALGLIRGGTTIPFFTAQHASGREAWTQPAAEVFALGEIFGANLRRAPEPVTPGQARKAGVPDEIVGAYAARPKGALRLTRVDDDAARLAFE